MRTILILTAVMLGLAACATVPPRQTIALTEQEARGYAFAKANCAACHAIMANSTARNPETPPFEDIVNTRGLTARTLETFLRDSHSFPGAMAFEIEPEKVDDLTAYMLTLKRAGYNPSI